MRRRASVIGRRRISAKALGGRAGHGHQPFSHVRIAISVRTPYRRAIGDLFDERRPKVTAIIQAAQRVVR